MPHYIDCPECLEEYEMDGVSNDIEVRCSECGHTFTVRTSEIGNGDSTFKRCIAIVLFGNLGFAVWFLYNAARQ